MEDLFKNPTEDEGVGEKETVQSESSEDGDVDDAEQETEAVQIIEHDLLRKHSRLLKIPIERDFTNEMMLSNIIEELERRISLLSKTSGEKIPSKKQSQLSDQLKRKTSSKLSQLSDKLRKTASSEKTCPCSDQTKRKVCAKRVLERISEESVVDSKEFARCQEILASRPKGRHHFTGIPCLVNCVAAVIVSYIFFSVTNLHLYIAGLNVTRHCEDGPCDM